MSMLTSMEEVISVAGPELLSQERLGQALGAMQVWLDDLGYKMVAALLSVPLMKCSAAVAAGKPCL